MGCGIIMLPTIMSEVGTLSFISCMVTAFGSIEL
ncbi:hypothetical protein, partial [Salmonella enterica]